MQYDKKCVMGLNRFSFFQCYWNSTIWIVEFILRDWERILKRTHLNSTLDPVFEGAAGILTEDGGDV